MITLESNMKHYNFKRYKLENSIDWKSPTGLRKYFNSSERQLAKRELDEVQTLLLEDKEIKVRDIQDIHRALDRKFNQVRFDFARTLHRFGVALISGGEKIDFRETYGWDDFHVEWNWDDLSEDKMLNLLWLSTDLDRVIDINTAIKNAKYTWWDELY